MTTARVRTVLFIEEEWENEGHEPQPTDEVKGERED